MIACAIVIIVNAIIVNVIIANVIITTADANINNRKN